MRSVVVSLCSIHSLLLLRACLFDCVVASAGFLYPPLSLSMLALAVLRAHQGLLALALCLGSRGDAHYMGEFDNPALRAAEQ